MDTIFAISSGAPPAAIAILRLSGPQACDAAADLAGALPRDRQAVLRALRDPIDGALLDRALVLVFRAPNTSTGEDVVELHLHGGRAVVAAVEQVLSTRSGLRRAQPGEFTRRALLNGRIDLTAAEGLGDLLSAETEQQRRVALFAAEGGIRRHIESWSRRLLDLSARIEAELDFAEEDDVADVALPHARSAAADLALEIRTILAQPPIERLRDGIRVVLAGPPNSGKSTLLNAMSDRDAAIVSPIAGTTRDRIDVPIHRNGMAFVLTDTAGLAIDTADPIEQIGIARAHAAIQFADIILWLGEDAAPAGALNVHARMDEPGRHRLPRNKDIAVSGLTGAGLQALWAQIDRLAASLLPRPDDVVLNERQRGLAASAALSLERSYLTNEILLVAEELRDARQSLDQITGDSDTEAMLDALFGTFCIGK